jgi:hypothetical protein
MRLSKTRAPDQAKTPINITPQENHAELTSPFSLLSRIAPATKLIKASAALPTMSQTP